MTVRCGCCRRFFTAIRANATYCSDNCRVKAWQEKRFGRKRRLVMEEWMHKVEAYCRLKGILPEELLEEYIRLKEGVTGKRGYSGMRE